MAAAFVGALADSCAAAPGGDCESSDLDKRVTACTTVIEAPDTTPQDRAIAYANRAYAYSVRGAYETAIKDFDAAISMFPNFGPALNNRAWAYFKWGKLTEADRDVERALLVDPANGETQDTRAHVSQWLGDKPAAIKAYDMAMVFGGSHMVVVYQCGLKGQHLYDGHIDGTVTAVLREAIQACVEKGGACDPLPPDEDCGAGS